MFAKNTIILTLFFVSLFCQEQESNKYIRKLVKQLKSTDKKVKVSALHSLGQLGQHASSALPAMVSLLKDNDPKIQKMVIVAFGNLKDISIPVHYELVKLLQSKNKSLVKLVRKTLYKMGKTAISHHVKYLNHDSFLVRSHILFVLGEIKASSVILKILKKLKDDIWQVRYSAIIAIGKINKEHKLVVPKLIEHLRDPSINVQRVTIEACGYIQPSSKELLKSLIKLFYTKKSSSIKNAILHSLGEIKIASPLLLPIFKKSILDVKLKKQAILAIAKIKYVRIAPDIIHLLKDNDYKIRIATIDIIASLKEKAFPFTKHLVVGFTDGKKLVRIHTANAIGKIGKKAAILALPGLLSLLEDIENDVQIYAAIALGKMGKNAIPILTDVLKNKKNLRSYAAYSLTQIGKDSVFTLIKLLKHKDESVRFYATQSLGGIKDKRVEKAIPSLLELLKTEKKKGHFSDVLGKIGIVAAKPLVPLLTNKNWQVRKAAADALAKMGPVVIPTLANLIISEDAHIQLYSIAVLGRMKEDAESVVPALINIYKQSSNFEIKKNILIALGSIKSKESVVLLKKVILSKNPTLQKHALNVVINIALMAKELIPELNFLLKNASWPIRKKAARSLSLFGQISVLPLMQTFVTGDDMAKAFSVIALGNIGEEAHQAVPLLIKALKEQNKIAIKENIIYALVSIKSHIKMTMTALQKELNSKNIRLKRATIQAMGEMKELGSIYIPKFLYETEQHPKELYQVTVDSIAKMGEKSIPYIIPFLKNKNTLDKEIIAKALGIMKAKNAIPHLLSALQDAKGNAQKEIIRSIKEIGTQKKYAVSTLSVFLRHKDWQIRELSAQAIAKIGKNAEIAVPVLLPLLADKSWSVRNATGDALVKIGGPVVIYGLRAALKKPFEEMQIHALISLKDIGREANNAIDDVIKILNNTNSIRVLTNAIYALGKISPGEIKVRRVLVTFLKNKDWRVQQAVSFVLRTWKK